LEDHLPEHRFHVPQVLLHGLLDLGSTKYSIQQQQGKVFEISQTSFKQDQSHSLPC